MFEMGYYTAYEHMLRDDVDLVVHLGDYIYEKADARDGIRPHGQPQVFTLDEYRIRYGIYKRDPALQAMHAAAPWIVTWDDHEVNNDYASCYPENPTEVTTEQFLRRRAAGYQAYYEHLPLRRSSLPHGPDMLLYRRLDYGRLARFHVLDTRQYRDDQPAGPDYQPENPVMLDAHRTILGADQRAWLDEGLAISPAVWNVVAQQVLMARPHSNRPRRVGYPVDKWAGYEHERRRFLRRLRDGRVRNPVVLTGDIHQNWANELTTDFDGDPRPVAAEFVGTSITSSGDGEATPDWAARLQADNPFVKFLNSERGYFRCEATPRQWRTDYRTVPYISRPHAPMQTPASFILESGRSELQRV
jgi:alkaline phosphatase D